MVRVCETRVKPLLVLCPTDTLQNSTKGFQTAARCLNLFLGHNAKERLERRYADGYAK